MLRARREALRGGDRALGGGGFGAGLGKATWGVGTPASKGARRGPAVAPGWYASRRWRWDAGGSRRKKQIPKGNDRKKGKGNGKGGSCADGEGLRLGREKMWVGWG